MSSTPRTALLFWIDRARPVYRFLACPLDYKTCFWTFVAGWLLLLLALMCLAMTRFA